MLKKASELSSKRKLLLFLGANIGNMDSGEAAEFCSSLRSFLHPGDQVLIGFDLKKHPKVILNAYNDPAGLTSRFNLNLLHRINRELGGNFRVDRFEHYQTYDPGTGSCKSYLVSLQAQEVRIGGHKIAFGRDETIFMEVSQKYTLEEIAELAAGSGFLPVRNITDSRGWFVNASWIAV